MPGQSSDVKEQILDVALNLAEQSSWEQLRLSDIAQQLEISLEVINQHYSQKDDLVEAWFDRADQWMLQQSQTLSLENMKPADKLTRVILLWFNALAPHQRLTRQMLAYKLEFGHIHLQVLGVMRISRTVQWFLEAALQKNTSFKRIIEEIIVTNIYLIAFATWLYDASNNYQTTEKRLGKLFNKFY